MNWEQLKPYAPLTFISANDNLTELIVVEKYYRLLESRSLGSLKDVEQWLLDRSELEAGLSQAGSILYIDMTCHTDNADKANAYTKFVETIPPAVKPINDRLNKKFLEAVKVFSLNQDRYGVMIQGIKTDIELFKPDNVPLQTRVELLSQEYQTVCGAMMVEFEGRERTMPEMGKYLLEPDRALRQQAWEASANRRLNERDKLEHIFDEMFKLRNSIAANAEFKNFIDYQFKNYHRFDYSSQDCKNYHESIEKHIVPLYGQILEQRKKEMKVSTLRPWDLAVDSLNRKPLKPFETEEQLVKGVQKIFDQLDSNLAKQFSSMRSMGLLDLQSRKGKAPGGYQNTLSLARVPFIFMNAVGVDDDVRTLLHEAGHAFHALAASQEPLIDYRHAPMEFCEVASMSMELLGGKYINAFYNEADAKRSNREHLEGIIQTLAWVATIDAFQHWLYEHPTHTPQERRQAWVGFYMQFGGQFIDWTGYEDIRAYAWHRQLHVFEVPFYYIEYGIAQLGSLQLWRNAKKDFSKALKDYHKGLSVGGSLPLPAIYEQANISFDFSPEIIKPLAQLVFDEWKTLI